ncbi:hypothetical protein [Plasmodium yoelii yoelii]|uniref:Uncharacterized protein n=1 Tax=Plasmodium yoelii yoelii TaxID=73239 RepID=Q7RFP2_PLAYO|nr:hypothetical protein [Plasmodium yoelii yoelii]
MNMRYQNLCCIYKVFVYIQNDINKNEANRINSQNFFFGIYTKMKIK